MTRPICSLCGHPIAMAAAANGRPFTHAHCALIAADIPEYRIRITWRHKAVLQRKSGLDYVDCDARDLRCGFISVNVPWPWAPPARPPEIDVTTIATDDRDYRPNVNPRPTYPRPPAPPAPPRKQQ